MVQFVFLGLLIYFGVTLRDQAVVEADRTVTVDAAVIDHLKGLYEVRYGYLPDDLSLEELVENYIMDEVLYREALKLGFDDGDEIIRQRLVQKMLFLLQDSAGIDPPAGPALEAWFNSHRDEFKTPVKVSFSHCYYSPEAGGTGEAAARAALALQLAGSGGDKIPDDGDVFPLQETYTALDRDEVVSIFGDSPFAQAIFSIKPGVWSGPYLSGLGWHLVLVDERIEAGEPSLDQYREEALEKYKQEAAAERNRERLARLKGSYTVVRDARE
jgi:hypothetical protein